MAVLTKGKSLASRLYAWSMLTDNLRPDLQRFPHLAGDLEELAAMHAEASALVSELARLRSQAQQATSRLRKLARRGDMLRTRVGAMLKGSLGFESIDLVKYGFRPRRSRSADETEDVLQGNDPKAVPAAMSEGAEEISVGNDGAIPRELATEAGGFSQPAGEPFGEPS
jgi:hypothetical protein